MSGITWGVFWVVGSGGSVEWSDRWDCCEKFTDLKSAEVKMEELARNMNRTGIGGEIRIIEGATVKYLSLEEKSVPRGK